MKNNNKISLLNVVGLIVEKQLSYVKPATSEKSIVKKPIVISQEFFKLLKQADKKIDLSCLPNERMKAFVYFTAAQKDEIKKDLGIDDATLIYLTKIAIALMGWQSKYGGEDRLYDVKPVNFSILGKIDISIKPWDVYNTIHGFLKNTLGDTILGPLAVSAAPSAVKALSDITGKDEPTFGPAEFMPSTFAKTGVEAKFGHGIETVIGTGLALIYNVWSKYQTAKNNGLSSAPSINPIAKNKNLNGWGGELGTPSHLWNVAIAAHSWPEEKILIKYCKTSRPDFMAPCSNPTSTPFTSPQTWESFKKQDGNAAFYNSNKALSAFPGTIKVFQNQPVPNYYPYMKGAHGVMENSFDSLPIIQQTNQRINQFGCVDNAF